ncbi:transmembrane protein 182-like isoform X2 [Harpia harpyja]|uniref:transmembrane protein 182-like isoform X2 n=1 Tax=Harpia harpyja TaxID=202280 RepID=UPI0022B09862|nr:transmembrane protein 182-like isoform X2 [Harpia harpyja]
MKAGVAALTAGILGGTGVLLFLIAFGTDYWLLAMETCGVFESGNSTLRTGEAEMQTEVRKEILTFHHEGFFWRCWFFGEGHRETIWTFWYTSQAHPKFCMHGYLFPMPIALGPFPHPSYDTTAGRWRHLSLPVSPCYEMLFSCLSEMPVGMDPGKVGMDPGKVGMDSGKVSARGSAQGLHPGVLGGSAWRLPAPTPL